MLDERKSRTRKGLMLTAAGIIIMILAGYLSFINPEKFFIHLLLLILFEPAGWFMLWTGLDHLIYYSKNTRNELEFYSKMVEAEIEFATY